MHQTVLFIHYSCNVLHLPLSSTLLFTVTLQSQSPVLFLFFCPDSLRPTLNYYCNLLQIGIYRLRYPGVINKKPRSVCNFMNVIRALQLLQRVFLEFQKFFPRFPGSIFASITEYTIGFFISYPPLP